MPVAQLEEYRSPKPRVAGSSPAWHALCQILWLASLPEQKTGCLEIDDFVVRLNGCMVGDCRMQTAIKAKQIKAALNKKARIKS